MTSNRSKKVGFDDVYEEAMNKFILGNRRSRYENISENSPEGK
jgi:hypothetical protein